MIKTAFTFLLLVAATIANAQGCSDAGFCTIGNLSQQTTEHRPNTMHALKLTLAAGSGDEEVFVFTPGLEYSFQKNRWQFSGKLTANYASGNLGNATGAGDLFLSTTYDLRPSSKWQTSITLATKLPLNQSNLKSNGISLPMQYQSSLGTVDAIVGLAVRNEKWKFAAGWQQPLTGINRNNFLPQYWRDAKANAYPATNDFNRKGDVLLRGSYLLLKTSKWTLESGLLGIYHLAEDSYIDANISKNAITIKGSGGLTLNATASLELAMNQRWSLGIVAGVPLVVRNVRPDGLTRSFVAAPQILYQF